MILFVLLVSLLGKNDLVVTAAALLMVMKFTRLNTLFPFLSERGIEMGILLLTISVMTPFAAGHIMPRDILDNLKSPAGLAALFSGIVASYLTGQGISLLKARPEIMVGLIMGSIIGATFFRGVPAGPLVAAGLCAVLVQLLNA